MIPKTKRNMKRNKLKSAIKVGNIQTYLNNKAIRNKFVFCFMPDGSSYYDFRGLKLNKTEIDLLYPLDIIKINYKGINPDKTRI